MARRNFTASGSSDMYLGKSTGMLPSCVGIRSGGLRRGWS